jgi:hypothetical protein
VQGIEENGDCMESGADAERIQGAGKGRIKITITFLMEKIKAWAVINTRGKIKMESFFTQDYMKGQATLSIFPYRKGLYEKNKPNALWGYAIGGERVISVEIRIPTSRKSRSRRKCIK